MKLLDLIKIFKEEIKSYKKIELYLFLLVFISILAISFYFHDSKIALINAICGIFYTIFAGYGKIYCYFIGIIGTFCYCYLAYQNAYWGSLFLYGLYYFPMEIIGIFLWKKNLKKSKNEIIKTFLNKKQRVIYFLSTVILSALLFFVLKSFDDKKPFLDAFVTVFSILGQLLTVKRCIEQWYIWFFVNLFSVFMWVYAILNGAKCTTTVFVWILYSILSVYFLKKWKKEIKLQIK